MSREERRRQARGAGRRRGQPRGRAMRSRLHNWGFLAAMVGATIVVIGLIIFSENLLGDDGGNDQNVSPLPVHTAETHGKVLGNPDAPVTIVEYSDFQCPFCRKVAATILPQIEQDYLVTGKAKYEFRPMSFIGQESVRAAEAAECATEQDAFWEYHNKLFDNQKGENKGAFKDDNLKRFAEEIGLDMSAFNACFDSDRYAEEVAAARDEARRRGIQSTPTVLVGSTVVQGSDYTPYRNAIEEELAKLGEATATATATPTSSPMSDETG